jgi:hypothetical protein
VRQGIGKIIKLAARKELRGHVLAQPQHLGHLHLDVHGAAQVAQQRVARRVDALRLRERAVIEPEDHVARVFVAAF